MCQCSLKFIIVNVAFAGCFDLTIISEASDDIKAELATPLREERGRGRVRERERERGGERDITLEYPKLILMISHTSTDITKEAQNS